MKEACQLSPNRVLFQREVCFSAKCVLFEQKVCFVCFSGSIVNLKSVLFGHKHRNRLSVLLCEFRVWKAQKIFGVSYTSTRMSYWFSSGCPASLSLRCKGKNHGLVCDLPAIATAASGTAPAIIPYFQGGGPAIIAYRPAGVLPSTSLLTAASFAYPFRLPVGAALPRPASTVGLPTWALAAVRPFSSDLQFAETKSKSNLTNSSDAKGSTKAGGLSAMARNLTKKMFGSASQIRPQHVAPPGTVYDMFALAQNSSSVSPGLQAVWFVSPV